MSKLAHSNDETMEVIEAQARGWRRVSPANEPAFWARRAHPHELIGLCPLYGQIIAYSLDECARIDAG